jgi:lipopolysaccharide assembly outer membrane protein LptD (OstA)
LRFCGPAIAALVAAAACFACPRHAAAQYQAPSEKLLMSAKKASSWSQAGTDIVMLEGPVKIELDRATLTAKRAVVWITPEPGANADGSTKQRVEVALLGDAKVEQSTVGTTRSGERMLVTAEVAGHVQLTTEDENTARDEHDTAAYREADAMRAEPAAAPAATLPAGPSTGSAAPAVAVAPTPAAPGPAAPARAVRPATRPATQPAAKTLPVAFSANDVQTVTARDGTVAVVLNGDVVLRQRRPIGDLLELLGQHAVIFTRLKSLRELQKSNGRTSGMEDVVGAYLQGDVRIRFTPVPTPNPRALGEQRLDANMVYYEFATDRAILTDVVLHTQNPVPLIPIVIHAQKMRQLAEGEFLASKAQVSSSTFAVPTFGVAADRIYVREEGEGLDRRYIYDTKGATLRIFNVPVFYFPQISGVADNNGNLVRGAGFGNQTGLGTAIDTELGLFEALDIYPPPRDLDAAFRAAYFTDRGPGTGFDVNYDGGFVTDTTKEPWNFEGDFRSFFVYDHGTDDVGRPIPANPSDNYRLRGYAQFEHQHFFPDDWQLQIRGNWVSDQEFLEQYFPRSFDTDLPHDESFYLKHQKDNEAFTLLYQFQPNSLVTSSDFFENQFEVEHKPEIGYQRLGESLANNQLSLYSQNLFDGLHFQHTRATLKDEGFIYVNPGIPSLGNTGATDQDVYRGDLREELDYPIDAGPFKLVPYVLGRYTGYSNSPEGGAKNRVLGGLGAKITTEFWKVDDTVESDLFDLHRLRHVIEPEVNLFTSAETVHRGEVYQYDDSVDTVNDISAASIALHQRWQTYRGGPGRWRSVDVFSLDLEADLYANQPTKQQLNPYGFRGLFFPSEPEISVPRNALNGNFAWRISDNTVLLGDAQQNLDEHELATASVGFLVRRDVALDYYLGTRYIAQLDSNVLTFQVDYSITPKYTVSIGEQIETGVGKYTSTNFQIVRRFDNCFLIVHAYNEQVTHTSGFGINFVPLGAAGGVDTSAIGNPANGVR